MEKYSTVVIGGGAAGICAAISTARRGDSVLICEKTSQLGKKILASGNGRCNLLNDEFTEDHFNPTARSLVASILSAFGKTEILEFFRSIGLEVYSREGRIFPVTNQATSVLKVLEMEMKRLAIPVEFNFQCSKIAVTRNGITVLSGAGKNVECRKVILTGGGKTYPAYGSDGSLYEVARQLGHSIVEPVPAVVPLVIKDSLCTALQGQRINAIAWSIIDGQPGAKIAGELLFTQYGLSGTCILDISESISEAIHRQHRKEVLVGVDLVSFMDKDQLKNELEKRRREKWPEAEMLVGILPNKFGPVLKYLFEKNDLSAAVNTLKNRKFKVSGTRGWNEAEFTSGGVNTSEITPGTLESKIQKRVFFAGEILDVNGQRGGYNLGWAWASGYIAGQSATLPER